MTIKTNQTFNIYCDESRVENPDSPRMVIGALFIPRINKPQIVSELKQLYKDYDFPYELKWTNTHHKYMDFYKKIIDFFVDASVLSYRCIIVDKTIVDYKKFHNNDPELAFFKFYYQMLKHKLLSHNRYYIFIDKKPTRDKNRARALHAYLDSHLLLHKSNCGIEHFQAYDSHENIMLQLSDYLTGLIGFACNEDCNDNSPKAEIVKYFKAKIKKDNFYISTPLSEDKCNIFVWQGIKSL